MPRIRNAEGPSLAIGTSPVAEKNTEASKERMLHENSTRTIRRWCPGNLIHQSIAKGETRRRMSAT